MKIVHKPCMHGILPVSEVPVGTLVYQASDSHKLGIVVRTLNEDPSTPYFMYLATGLVVKDPEYKVIPVPKNHNVIVCND